MRTRLLNLALLAAVALAVIRLWLFVGAPPPTLPPVDPGATQPASTADREQKAADPEIPPGAYDAIVARDLFSPARGVVPPAPAAASQPAAKPLPVPKLTLYGVVILDGEKTAFLQEGTQEGRPRKVRENESFAGGIVKTIRPDGVTLLFAGEEISVPLRTPKAGMESPAPRAQFPGGAAPRVQAPAVSQRRQRPTGIQQGQMPLPGRPSSVAPGMPGSVPGMPADVSSPEPGGEVFEDEEFPEGFMPGDVVPGMTEEEAGN